MSTPTDTATDPGFLEQELDLLEIDGKVIRRGKKSLLKEHGWSEFSVYPKGKRISLDTGFITSVSEGEEGEAIIAVRNPGQPHILIRLLDLYGPTLREVLLKKSAMVDSFIGG